MLAKTLLVYWLLLGRGDVQVQYAVRFPDEATCQAEAYKTEKKNGGLQAYPIPHATCVMDVTAPAAPQTKK